MTDRYIIDYYKKWGKNRPEIAEEFVYMLSQKAYFSATNDTEVFANDGLKNANQLDAMILIAEKLIQKGKI